MDEKGKHDEHICELENLKVRARSNPELAQALLATRGMKNPVSAFCRIAQEHGCTFSAMDLVSAGEDSYAAMRRSTNGGGGIRRCCRERMICTRCF